MIKESEKILEALSVQVLPHTSDHYYDDEFIPSQERLISLLRGALADSVSGQSMLDQYLKDPNVWRGVMLDVIEAHQLTDHAELMEEVYTLLRYDEAYDPRVVNANNETSKP